VSAGPIASICAATASSRARETSSIATTAAAIAATTAIASATRPRRRVSSLTASRGAFTRARPIPTRCRSPTESCAGRWFRRADIPRRSSTRIRVRRLRARAPGEQPRERHVLEAGEVRDEVEGLEDEPDVAAAERGARLAIEIVHARLAEEDVPGGERVHLASARSGERLRQVLDSDHHQDSLRTTVGSSAVARTAGTGAATALTAAARPAAGTSNPAAARAASPAARLRGAS
jgi:hypothetical protein